MRTKLLTMAMAAALLSAPLAVAEMKGGTLGTEPGASSAPAEPDSATKGRSQPRRGESRRSGVPGTREMAPGSGAQGAGTENGPDGSGLTGSEGQDDTLR